MPRLIALYRDALLRELVWLAEGTCPVAIPVAAHVAALTARRLVRLNRYSNDATLRVDHRRYLASLGIK